MSFYRVLHIKIIYGLTNKNRKDDGCTKNERTLMSKTTRNNKFNQNKLPFHKQSPFSVLYVKSFRPLK